MKTISVRRALLIGLLVITGVETLRWVVFRDNPPEVRQVYKVTGAEISAPIYTVINTATQLRLTAPMLTWELPLDAYQMARKARFHAPATVIEHYAEVEIDVGSLRREFTFDEFERTMRGECVP